MLVRGVVMKHVDKWQLSAIIGTPPRAICRWLKMPDSIPHTGSGHLVMFPLDPALEWVRVNKPALHRDIQGAGS